MNNRLSGSEIILGAQMLFVAFGALVLVTLITGRHSSIALLTVGIWTLIFQVITQRKIPISLASSLPFIAPIQIGLNEFGLASTLGSLVHHKIYLSNPRNLVIVAVILVFGIGDMVLGYNEFQLTGIGLAGIVGVLLNSILPNK